MPGEASAIVAELPPWLQVGANAALFVITAAGGLLAVMWNKKGSAEKESEPFHAEDLLDSSPIRRFIAAAEALADNAKLQTESLGRISAATTALAKLVEEDFDERRVDRAVERRLEDERKRRERDRRERE